MIYKIVSKRLYYGQAEFWLNITPMWVKSYSEGDMAWAFWM
jgi:hypothetical protein